MFPHNEEVSITASGNWFVGESKNCTAYPPNESNTKIGNATSFLNCDNGPKHQVQVEFWGREEQPEYEEVYWKCRRGERGFTCYETSGLPVITVEDVGRAIIKEYPAYAPEDPVELGRALKRKYPDRLASVRDINDAPQLNRPTPPPAIGAIVKGYRFKGGDPAAESNWQKLFDRDTTDEVTPWNNGRLDRIFGVPPLRQQPHQ